MPLLDISTWWQSMLLFEKIFWVIAILFSLMFLIQSILSFAGGDGDAVSGEADEFISHDDGIGYQFFTIKNMIAFFTIFGWTGIACINGNMSKGTTIIISLIAGSIVVVIMAFLFRTMSRLKHSGTFQISNTLNKIGETYLIIPAKRSGFGKIHIKVQGGLHELQAITDDEIPIPTGKLIKVKDVINGNILVVTSDFS